MCLTGNKGWVEACGETLEHAQHTYGIKKEKDTVHSCSWQPYLDRAFEHVGVCARPWVRKCTRVSKCLCVASPFAAVGSSQNWELDVGKL